VGWGGNNSWTHPPFFRDIWSHRTSETLFLFVIFSILDCVQQKVNVLLTSPSNQFRDYHTWNRIEKLMPLNWNFAPPTLKTSQKTTNVFSNLDFLQKSGFPKTRDLSMGFHGFSMEAGGRHKMWGVVGGAGAPSHEGPMGVE